MLATIMFNGPHGPAASTSMAARTAFHRCTILCELWCRKSLMACLRSAARRAGKWRISSSRVVACRSSSSWSWSCVMAKRP